MNMTCRKPQSIASLLGFVCLCLAILPARAAETFDTLAQRLPAGTNMVMAVNVAKMLDAPYAKTNGWAEMLARRWEEAPAMIPPGATRVLMAAEVRVNTMESRWELSLIDMDNVPTVQALAASDGGYVERIWDKDAACSPINAYFIPLDKRILASITPAARAEIAKWIRTPLKPEGNVTSPYINTVLKSLTANTQVVMALDLEGAWGLPVIRRFLEASDIKEIQPRTMDATVFTMASMNGVRLDVTVSDKIAGKITVEFDKDAAALKDSAKPIMLAILDAAGMRIEELKDWRVLVLGKQVIMEGNLEQPSLRQLFGIVQSPVPAAVAAKPTGAAGATSAASTDPAAASQRYYKAICGSLDSLGQSKSISATAVWFRNTSKRIEQLPILNVDPALVEWGSMVTLKLKQAAATLSVGGMQTQARVAGVMNPEYTVYENWGTSGAPSTLDPAYTNTVRERQRVATEQKAQSADQALRILEEIGQTRPRIRAEMVQKYKVEF